jgi:hypothetical protein
MQIWMEMLYPRRLLQQHNCEILASHAKLQMYQYILKGFKSHYFVMCFTGGTELWVLLLVDYFDLLKTDVGCLTEKPLLNCSVTVER